VGRSPRRYKGETFLISGPHDHLGSGAGLWGLYLQLLTLHTPKQVLETIYRAFPNIPSPITTKKKKRGTLPFEKEGGQKGDMQREEGSHGQRNQWDEQTGRKTRHDCKA